MHCLRQFSDTCFQRKDRRLTQESFAASALGPSELVDPGAASSGSAAQQRCRTISKLQQELNEVATEIQELIQRSKPLTQPVLTWAEAQEKSMIELYKPRCGSSRVRSIPGRPYQDRAEMTAQASAQLDARIHDFVMPRDEINENTRGLYPYLLEIKNRRQC